MAKASLSKRSQGFTLAEMVIIVAVTAIFVSIALPQLYGFLTFIDTQREQIQLTKIARAIELHSQEYGQPPLDDNNLNPNTEEWFTRIARFTELSELEVREDVWGEPRQYISFRENDNLAVIGNGDDEVTVHYVTVHSKGPDRTADGGPGIALNGDDFDDPADPNWWKNQPSPEDAFGNVWPAAGSDDQIAEFNNFLQKRADYEELVQRIDNIAAALESFADEMQNIYLANQAALTPPQPADPQFLGTRVFYPRSQPQTNVPPNNDPIGNYFGEVWNMSNINGAATGLGGNVYTGTDDDIRRDEMQNLMRLLGLPFDHCCNPLVHETTGTPARPVDPPQQRALFYFSNPRPINAGVCQTRPGPGEPKLPPRIATDLADACG